MWLLGRSKTAPRPSHSKVDQANKDGHYARMTFTLPKEVAAAIAKMPSQKRSREISAILKEEFARRKFVKNLEQFTKEPPFLKE